MQKKVPDTILEKTHSIFVIIFAGITFLIVIYPTRYFFGFSNLNGLDIFQQPFLFTILYGTWVGVYVILSTKSSYSAGSRLAIIISIVSAILVYKVSPLGFDHNYGITFFLSSYLGSEHHIPTPIPPQYSYFSYPGLIIVTESLKSVASVSYVGAGLDLSLVFFSLIGFSIFVITYRLCHEVTLAMVAVPLYFTASYEAISNILLFPATLGVTLLALTFLLLVKRKFPRQIILLLVLFAGMIITHFYDPVDIFFVFITVYLFQNILHTKLFDSRIISASILLLLADLSWQAIAAPIYFNGIVLAIISSLSHASLSYASVIVRSNTLGVPFWVTLIRYYDILVTSIAGILLAVWTLVKRGKRESDVTLYSVITMAIVMFGLAAAFASLFQGGFDFLVGIQFVVFFSLPVFLYYLKRFGRLKILVILSIIMLSGPSLLTLQFKNVSSYSVYPSELSIGGYFTQYTPSATASVSTDGKTFGIIATSDPFAIPQFYSIPISTIPYVPGSFSVIDQTYSSYQEHLYGTSFNLS
ncbi:MAG: hypothetical protein JRN20_20050, partial [Nitrososphaerota archaeon]|nr:hypothetical protein [Nitrososphaerota archaeon]